MAIKRLDRWHMRTRVLAVFHAALLLCASTQARAESPPNYLENVRPILSDNCFECHGPDEETRSSGLRLDSPEGSRIDLGGYAAIVPGEPSESELLVRVLEHDADLKMPPPTSGKSLSRGEIETLRRWVESGANYETHWSFAPIERPPAPEPSQQRTTQNPIDSFIGAKLAESGLNASAQADRYELVRRAYLDLIGLPPTVEEAQQFVDDPSPTAYEDLVDRILQSPHYGERWARRWLDLARYADTKGYEKDKPRTMWPYRDWVIDAINSDMPFDQFTIEQLAGDMLPNATVSQRIAAGFHRNTMTNEEGGIDPQEFRFLAVVDRVATTGTTWLGLTIGCAQCHTHKYDPITHQDYYRFFALLNNADEIEVEVPSEVDVRRASLQRQIEEAHKRLRDSFTSTDFPPTDASDATQERSLGHQFEEWLEDERKSVVRWTHLAPESVEAEVPTTRVLDDHSVLVSGDVTKADTITVSYRPRSSVTAIRLEALPHPSLPDHGPGRQTIRDNINDRRGNFFLSEVKIYAESSPMQSRRLHVTDASATFVPPGLDAQMAIDDRVDTGWTVYKQEGRRQCLVLTLESPATLKEGEVLKIALEHDSYYPASLGRFRISGTDAAAPSRATGHSDRVVTALARPDQELTNDDRDLLLERFLQVAPELQPARDEIERLEQRMPPRTTALTFLERSRQPRKTNRHHRGEYLRPQEVVAPGVPECLPSLHTDSAADRLALAQWLVDRENPLTARVIVNRWWEAFFGTGLVQTSADFGMQGEYPSHPELLDWLAMELIDSGWSRKHLHRLIVTSHTYRQSSVRNVDSATIDPANRLLSYMPRRRVDAETVRDIVLTASGLLTLRIGGPSVFPPQPAGITEAAYSPFTWSVSEGPDRYRRGLYTFAKRTAPYAAFGLFDSPSGEVCTARRDRSNTPLQSLAMLNDEVIRESARHLAVSEYDATLSPTQIAEQTFQRCVTRKPTQHEIAAILSFHQSQLERLRRGELDGYQILDTGPTVQLPLGPNPEAWTASQDASLDGLDLTVLVESTGEDPFIRCNVTSPAGKHILKLRAKFSESDTGQVFWTTRNRSQESSEMSSSFQTAAGVWKTYEIDFESIADLTSLRIDVGTRPGTTQIESMALCYGDGLMSLPQNVDHNVLAAWQLVCRAILNLDETIMTP